MNYTSKFLEYEKNTQRLANLIEAHSATLKFFEKANRFGHNPYNYSTIQNAHKILLETQGISKTLIGLQSMAQQIQEVQKIAGSLGDIARTTALPAMNSHLVQQMQEVQKIAGSLGDIAHTTALLGMNSGLVPQFQEAQIIAGQIPFITKLQTKIPQIEPIFIEATKVATSLMNSAPFTVSALSVATASINFSARLDNFPYPEQLRIVDALDSLNLDTDTDIEILEDLPEEMQTDYVTLTKFAYTFWQKNREFILGVLATIDTTARSFSENDFSNIFTIILFTYYCASLIYISLNQEEK